ncbi:MAG: hypothetical protein ABJD02_18000 [Paraglaciecola sp.]|uniref:hypothetical protein n=1 Tax=Paraglaciecola sp. TaxID=1920173 RepID=UPI0032671C6E
MEISKDSDLMALHRAIVEAKFKDSPNDEAIPFSGILSRLSHEIFDSIVESLTNQGEIDEAEEWNNIRKLSVDWSGYSLIKQRIEETGVWLDLSHGDKIELIKVLCSPYKPSVEQLDELLLTGNSRHHNKQ